MKSDVVDPKFNEDQEAQTAVQADLPIALNLERSTESADPPLNTQPEESTMMPASSTEDENPSSPMMDLETDFPPGETLYNLNCT